MGRRKAGHPPKTLCDSFRGAAFYSATALEAHLEFACEVTPAFLNRLFPPKRAEVKGGGNWYRYRDGQSLPGRGTYKESDTDLVLAVGKRYPTVPGWLTKPLFVLADTRELTIPQIHALMLELATPVQELLITNWGNDMFSRKFGSPELVVDDLLSLGTLEALAGTISLIREAHLYQYVGAYKIFYEGMLSLLHCLDKETVTAPFAQEFSMYVTQVFKHMWVLIPGLYYEHPSKVHPMYRGALSVPFVPCRRISIDSKREAKSAK